MGGGQQDVGCGQSGCIMRTYLVHEMQPDGSSKYIFRKMGDYALANPDALPHTECGGDDGGTVS